MSDVRDPDRDQVAPIPNDGPSCHDLVIEDMKERKEFGLRKYDSLLQPHNGRNFLLDIYEELLDATVYMRGLLEKQQESAIGLTYVEPTEPGFYRYSGGAQRMVFLLNDQNRWFVIFRDSYQMEPCSWGYIEQALSVWNLVKIEGDGS